jgi:hypothetical protein
LLWKKDIDIETVIHLVCPFSAATKRAAAVMLAYNYTLAEESEVVYGCMYMSRLSARQQHPSLEWLFHPFRRRRNMVIKKITKLSSTSLATHMQ